MGVYMSRGSEIANLTSFLSACPFPKKIETLMIFLLDWRSIFKRAVCVPSPPPRGGRGGRVLNKVLEWEALPEIQLLTLL